MIPIAHSFNSSVQKTTLPNGVRVVTERMPVRSISLGIWIRAGTVNENETNNGISHLLEHMLFKGTKTRTAREIASSLESRGGALNGSTGKEVSLFNATVLDEDLEVAVDVLSDLVLHPQLADHDLKLEKQVVISEINHATEDPEELLLDHFYHKLYPNHPLGYFILGKPKVIIGTTVQDLSSFHWQNYLPEHTVLAAAGNVDHHLFEQFVRNYFQSESRAVLPPPTQNISEQPIAHFEQKIDSLQQTHICLGCRIFGYHDERRYAMILLDTILGGGMSSRLFQNIREKYGFAYSIYSFVDFMQHTGVFGCYMACAPQKTNRSIDLLQQEFRRLRTRRIADNELERAKTQINGQILLGLESSAQRMRRLGENETFDYPHQPMNAVLEKIQTVRASQLQEIAAEFFDPSKLCLTMLVPA